MKKAVKFVHQVVKFIQSFLFHGSTGILDVIGHLAIGVKFNLSFEPLASVTEVDFKLMGKTVWHIKPV